MRSKIGFTSKTFPPIVAGGRHSMDDILRWAADSGFGWMELRDTGADMPMDRCGSIAEAAARCGLTVHYAWDGTNVLEPADADLAGRGIARAQAFGGGVLSRVTIAGALIKGRTTTAGYTPEEHERLSSILPSYIAGARVSGVGLVFENSYEPIYGDGKTYRGVQELLDRVPAMKLTFDPANALREAAVRVHFVWADMVQFYRRNAGRIPYTHVKSIRDGKFPDELVICEEDQEICLGDIMDGCAWVCLELPQQDAWDRSTQVLAGARSVLEKLAAQ